MKDRIVRETERRQLTGISRTTAWKLEQAGEFPLRRKLTPNGKAIGWLYSELLAWINERNLTADNALNTGA